MSALAKTALANSLKELLTKKTSNKITIINIVDNCGLNRQTFYYHFQDIYELLAYVFQCETQLVIENKLSYIKWETCLNDIFEYITDNRKFITNVYRSFGKEDIEQCLYQVQMHQLEAVISDFDKENKITQENRDFISSFISHAIVGMCLQWIQEGMKEDYHTLTGKAAKLLSGNIAKFVEQEFNWYFLGRFFLFPIHFEGNV